MRPALLCISALLASTLAFAQAPAKPAAPAAKPAAASMKLPAASAPPLAADTAFPTPEQLAELTCANEYNFIADKVGENRFVLRLDTQSAACKTTKRVVHWKFSGDDGITFVDLAQNEYVRALKPTAQGVEIEVIPNVRFFAIGSVPIMEGVNADGPVLAFGASEMDMLQAIPAEPVQRTVAKKP